MPTGPSNWPEESSFGEAPEYIDKFNGHKDSLPGGSITTRKNAGAPIREGK